VGGLSQHGDIQVDSALLPYLERTAEVAALIFRSGRDADSYCLGNEQARRTGERPMLVWSIAVAVFE
jgi:hypothetical protein